MALTAIPFGLAIGLSLGTLGGGGSVLAVPIFVYVLGIPVHEATTSSLVVVTIGALAGGVGHARGRRICWRHAAAFTAAALPGVVAGTRLADAVGGRALISAFAVIMLGAAAATWRKATGARTSEAAAPALCPPLRIVLDLAAGLLVGALTGFFGVGGGFLIVPTLMIALTLSMRLAVGTSLAVITATSVMALVTHLVAGHSVDAGVTLAMSGACVAGALAGTRLAGRLPQRRLGQAFATLIVGLSGYLLVSATVLGGPPGAA